MATQRSHTIQVTGGSSISLGDLRWLVEQLKDASDDHSVSVSYSAGSGNYDRDESRLSTTVPDAPAKPSAPVYRGPNISAQPVTAKKWIVTNGFQEMESQDER